MSATAALSPAAVAEFATQGTDAFLALTIALRSRPRSCTDRGAAAAGGFVASFISEPVLKGFIIGLALTIIVGQFEDLPDTTLAVVIAAVIELVDVQ